MQIPVGKSSATHRHFCKSDRAVGRAGAAYMRAASLSHMLGKKWLQILGGCEHKDSRKRAFCTSAAAILFRKEIGYRNMKDSGQSIEFNVCYCALLVFDS